MKDRLFININKYEDFLKEVKRGDHKNIIENKKGFGYDKEFEFTRLEGIYFTQPGKCSIYLNTKATMQLNVIEVYFTESQCDDNSTSELDNIKQFIVGYLTDFYPQNE
ncbi:MAG: hypothetical protein PHV07_02930 [Oscillospiraceae bacterium]|nr:hypothetical protein [Oscillospiraceae bacterium]